MNATRLLPSRSLPGHDKSRPRPGRDGAALFAVIAALTIASILWLSLIRTAATERRVIRQQQWRAQAVLLADSGLERAVARLATDADYEGETWRIPADLLDGKHASSVVIAVEAADDEPRQDRRVRVTAHYPEAIELRMSETVETIIESVGERNTL